MLEETAGHYAGKTAIVLNDRRLSYAELDEASNKVANALMELGIGKGDRVAMLLANSPEFLIIYFGVVKTGAIVSPLDVKYTVHELASLFNNFQPKVLVTESPSLEPLVPALPRFESVKHVIDLSSKYEGQFLSYKEIMATGSARRIEVELEPEDVAYIAYASGPTLRPRGVMLTHGSLTKVVSIQGKCFQQTDKDVVILHALPMHYVFGLAVLVLTSLSRGSTVIMAPGTSIRSVNEIVEKERATIFMGVPFTYASAVSVAEREGIDHDLSSLRLCCTAGAALPINIVEPFRRLYGLDIIEGWGLTESITEVTCQPIDGTGKLGSAGKVLPGWELKVVDDNGRELPPNQSGELIVKGPIMKGYYNNPQATAKTVKDGWLYTGDIGRLDEDGYLFITGRKKEMILVKGRNIYPTDIEDVLTTHPKVAEAAAVGVPDEIRGEVIRAVITLKEGEKAAEGEIRSFCREHLAEYKLPKQIIFVDSLPKTANGKIRKEELRDYSLASLSSASGGREHKF